jgi:hypothetical protein
LDAAPTFGSSVNLTYNGSTAYVCGFEMPTVSTVLNNLTINNAGGVFLNGNTTVNGIATFAAGALLISANTLTVNGGCSVGTGTIAGTTESSLIFAGSTAGPISIPGITGSLNNLTINNTNSTPATYNLAGAATIGGTLSLTSGNLNAGAFALTLNGPAISGTGTLTATGALSFGGTDAGPLNIPASITSITSLTLNNTNATPATLNLNGALNCTGLALTSGTIADGGNTLTVNYDGSVAEAYYQPEPFYALDSVNVLYPKFELDTLVGLFIASMIRNEKYRFNYGRKWHLERMSKSRIKLPATPNGELDIGWIHTYMANLPGTKELID